MVSSLWPCELVFDTFDKHLLQLFVAGNSTGNQVWRHLRREVSRRPLVSPCPNLTFHSYSPFLHFPLHFDYLRLIKALNLTGIIVPFCSFICHPFPPYLLICVLLRTSGGLMKTRSFWRQSLNIICSLKFWNQCSLRVDLRISGILLTKTLSCIVLL